MINDRSPLPRSGWRQGNRARPQAFGPGRCRRRPRGFTLIELLVAITLFGLIAVLLFGGLRFGTRAWEAGIASSDRVAEVHLAQNFLRRQLSQARDIAPKEARALAEAPFEGMRQEMSFVSVLPDHIAVGGLYRLSVYVSGEVGRKRLVASWRLLRSEAGGPGQGEPEETVLLERIEDVEFSYLAPGEDGAAGLWRNGWQEEDGLPQLVRIRVEFADGDSRYWPELVVAPRLARGA